MIARIAYDLFLIITPVKTVSQRTAPLNYYNPMETEEANNGSK